MKNKKISMLISFLALILLASLSVYAATTGSHSVTANIPSSLKLTVANTTVNFNAVAFDGVPVEYAGDNTVSVQVLCNTDTNWYLKVKADDDLKTADATPYIIAASKISLNTGSGTYAALSKSFTSVATGAKTGGWQQYNMQYKLGLDGTEYAGSYSTSITYELATTP